MELITLLLIGGAIISISGVIGMAIGQMGRKGNGRIGFVLGGLLGPIGWLVVAVQPAAVPEDARGTAPVVVPRQTGPWDPDAGDMRIILGALGLMTLALLMFMGVIAAL